MNNSIAEQMTSVKALIVVFSTFVAGVPHRAMAELSYARHSAHGGRERISPRPRHELRMANRICRVSGRVGGWAATTNIARDLKAGDVQPWAEALYQQRVRDMGKDAPRANCLPDPFPYYRSSISPESCRITGWW